MKINLICSKCGKEPDINDEKSNKTFKVIDNKPCKYCGGNLTLKFNNGKKNK